ncbi:SH3 domain-containing protein [Puia dinghuensis]|uniref:SH3b domain-containing protein n=1 Tax=Puia dinghuensis TaxID=1792502 RepID=A0A8J2XPS1_9BACT|nr:SH3 domain-containing protein [Puia dinghuensis]GGA81753.1 hypothetical protein GCM10011511_00870 [Puia dinghuensis]
MKPLLILLLCNLLGITGFSQVHVNGYYRKDGTYVQSHYRSSPDGNPYNNYSYPGNVNPYTGKVAPGNTDTYLYHYYNRNSYSNTPSSYYPTTTYPASGLYSPTNTYGAYLNTTEATVSAEKLNVRFGPGSSSLIITTLNYGDVVYILNRSLAPWYYVQFSYYDPNLQYYKTTSGYLHSSYLSMPVTAPSYSTTSYPDLSTTSYSTTSSDLTNHSANFSGVSASNPGPSTQAPYDPSGDLYFVTTIDLKVLSAPYSNADILTHLTFKDGVKVISTAHSPWYQVNISYLDESGYIRSTTRAYVYGPDLSATAPTFVCASSPRQEQTLPEHSVSNTSIQPYGPNKGKINFWNSLPGEDIALYIDHIYKGQLTTYFSEQPNSCGGAGMISTIDVEGKHLVQAIGKKFHWSGYIFIHADQCETKGLGKELN